MNMGRILNPLKRQIGLMIGRGIINLIDATREIQLAQVEMLFDETHDDVERFTDYGFASNPPKKSEAIVLSLGGVRSHNVIIATHNRQFQLKLLESGEVAIYDDLGQKVHLERDGISIETPFKLRVDAPNTQWVGNIEIDGQLNANDVLAQGISLKSHMHIQVKTGTDKSGLPE